MRGFLTCPCVYAVEGDVARSRAWLVREAPCCSRERCATGRRRAHPELGCGWRSLSRVAANYLERSDHRRSPTATQKEHVDGEARRHGLGNLEVVTATSTGWDLRRRPGRVESTPGSGTRLATR